MEEPDPEKRPALLERYRSMVASAEDQLAKARLTLTSGERPEPLVEKRFVSLRNVIGLHLEHDRFSNRILIVEKSMDEDREGDVILDFPFWVGMSIEGDQTGLFFRGRRPSEIVDKQHIEVSRDEEHRGGKWRVRVGPDFETHVSDAVVFLLERFSRVTFVSGAPDWAALNVEMLERNLKTARKLAERAQQRHAGLEEDPSP